MGGRDDSPSHQKSPEVTRSHQCLQDFPVADLLRRCRTIDLRFLKCWGRKTYVFITSNPSNMVYMGNSSIRKECVGK